MPLKGFYCPDGQKIAKEDCFTQCRMGSRCRSLKYLSSAGYDRPFTGTFSTTQLINPTRMAYLKITTDYYVEPNDRAFAILGTSAHARLDLFAKRMDLVSELRIKNGDIAGILDALEPDDNQPDCFKLIDSKTWGSYAVQKTVQTDTTLQLNHYKYLAEHDDALSNAIGRPIKIVKLLVEVIVRDGGTWIAKDRKVSDKVTFIEIPIMDEGKVVEYFARKKSALQNALDIHTLPPVCDDTWNWRRCKAFCDHWRECPEGLKLNIRRV